MRLRALLAGAGMADLPVRDVTVKGISSDTRTLRPGELFVALRGYKTDGHRYIGEALEKGAAAVLCEQGAGPNKTTGPDSRADQDIYAIPDSRAEQPIYAVPDTRAALAAVSAAWFGHPARELTLVGVTGTNGKTTTTTLLKTILEQTLHTKVGLLGTNENRIGGEIYPADRTTPESYEVQQWLRRMADGGCTHVVMEVSSHALCLHRVDGLIFAVGAFTNLTRDHLDFHGSMENYRAAKARLFEQSQVAVLNLDDGAGRHYAETAPCPVFTYSERRDEASLTAKNLRLFPDRVEFEGVTREAIARVRLGIPGGFTVYNALCALSCACALGIPLARAAAALAEAPGVKGRMEVLPVPGPGTVLIDYAHTPDALENALAALRGFTKGRLICLFGCGGDRDRGKRAVMGSVAAGLADLCVVTSDNPRTEDPDAIIADILKGMEGAGTSMIVEPDRPAAIGLALDLLREGDTLLLAGKGHETYQEVNGEKRHMDEREIVAAHFPKKS